MRALRSILAPAFASAILLAACIAGGTARADEQSELDKVRAAYAVQKYDEAEARLRDVLDPKHPALRDPALVTQARMYLAAVLIAKKQPDQATPVFEKILLDDPDFEPDILSFPTEVIDQFIDTRARLRERLNELAQERARKELERKIQEEDAKRREVARVAMLERLAGEEKVTTLSSRWLALVPFGTGQFQNGDRALGWFFLATETACVVGTGVTVPIYLTDSRVPLDGLPRRRQHARQRVHRSGDDGAHSRPRARRHVRGDGDRGHRRGGSGVRTRGGRASKAAAPYGVDGAADDRAVDGRARRRGGRRRAVLTGNVRFSPIDSRSSR